MYYVYILTNKTNRVLYIGVTNNLERRLLEHRNGVNEGFTKKYHVHKLVYYECFSNPNDAIKREKYLKGWTRAKKTLPHQIHQPHPLGCKPTITIENPPTPS